MSGDSYLVIKINIFDDQIGADHGKNKGYDRNAPHQFGLRRLNQILGRFCGRGRLQPGSFAVGNIKVQSGNQQTEYIPFSFDFKSRIVNSQLSKTGWFVNVLGTCRRFNGSKILQFFDVSGKLNLNVGMD